MSSSFVPHVVVVTVFAKAGSNRSAFLLDDGTFVGDSLCGAHITDELFYWIVLQLVRWETDNT